MKANELRVGNLVHAKKLSTGEQKVIEITINNIIYHSGYSPIPLTEEILLKCGFKDNCFNEWIYVKHIIDDIYSVCINQNMVCPIKYVHQLQNLYLSLTGKELKIEL